MVILTPPVSCSPINRLNLAAYAYRPFRALIPVLASSSSTRTTMAPDLQTPMSFSDFPNDVQLNILSFLQPTDISAFACTCRRFATLCSPSSPSTDLWIALCDRRWGSNTQLRRWSAIPSPRLYKTLDRWENLIGFWRRIGSGISETPTLVFFEWSSSCIIGFRISRSPVAASYAVCKTPFLWLGFSAAGETSSYLNPDSRLSDSDVIPVTISFMGCNHLLVEESRSSSVDKLLDDSEDWLGLETGSPPDRLMSEIYQYFANRTSPGAEKSTRRLRKKKEKERLGRRRWEAEHFVKISNYFPTPSRPLQGLWKLRKLQKSPSLPSSKKRRNLTLWGCLATDLRAESWKTVILDKINSWMR
ncbi:F-box protein At3g12350 isoform X2 [Phalaenopsis equestris]|uniref:F-box protein At3g12350 isoform X2 n=1 Tax=Phalaenopsis equestris TaxID=78828 RepID=UPI0009E210A6|nr:F-box protein At3g12350 isoform X2 [Phalaenopsis equestris]